jgi:hypothetical protein
VTGGKSIAADDVVALINYINAHPSSTQGEALDTSSLVSNSFASPSAIQQMHSTELLDRLATDWTGQPKRRLWERSANDALTI